MDESRTVLVTGGAGYIGSHICLDLLQRDHEVVVVDDYSNSSRLALDRVAEIAGKRVVAHEADVRNYRELAEVFERHRIDVVVHLAGKKHVAESIEQPLTYYGVNVAGTHNVLRLMDEHDVPEMVFSSSCSVYGHSQAMPLRESCAPNPTNPYARSKWMAEQMISDHCRRSDSCRAISLRYFNPIGAHPSGSLGEAPVGAVTNVVPHLMRVAANEVSDAVVFGSDYATPDGTPVRDYLHVMDLADAHRMAIEHASDVPGMEILNVGTGRGTSVLELIAFVGETCGHEIPYRILGRRPGDVGELVADASAIAARWDWRPQRDMSEMCADAWRFHCANPSGYQDSPAHGRVLVSEM